MAPPQQSAFESSQNGEACSPADQWAHILATLPSSRGTLSEETDKALGRNCAAPPIFNGETEMLKQQHEQLAQGKPLIQTFILAPQNSREDLHDSVEQAIRDLSEVLGR